MILQKSMLGGGFKHFLFSPRNPGKMIQFDVHIFFKWVETNHQLGAV